MCPLSRQVRVYLKELGIEFNLIKEEYWRRRPEFIAINPAGTTPVLVESFGLTASGIYVITEYLYDKYPNFTFMDDDSETKCEIRRLLCWFNDKFYSEVSKILIDEKVLRSLSSLGSPRTERLRTMKSNLTHHMRYLSALLEKQGFIVSERITCADITAACHLSVIDYFGEIYWDHWPIIRHWYAILKSRPSFQLLLQDQISGFAPANGYRDLDF